MVVRPSHGALFAALVLALGMGAAHADQLRAGSAAWSIDAFAAVHQEAAESSATVAFLPTNTKVTVVSLAGNWCQIEAPRLRGQVKCSSLGSAPVTLENLGTGDPAEARKRAFWVAPSWWRLLAVGKALPEEVLSEAQRKAELQSQEIRRHENPLFEAMKKRLAEGAALRAEREIEAKVTPPGAADADLPAGALPAAKPSLFKSRREIVVSPTPDQAAALRNGNLALKAVTDTPALRDLDGTTIVDGAWDIGQAELRFTPAAVLYTVAADGTLSATAVATAVAEGGQYQSACARPNPLQQLPFWKPKDLQALPGYPGIPAQAVIARFFSARDLKPGVSQVVTRVLRTAVRTIDGRVIPEKMVVLEIDLDGDGNADLVQVKGQAPGTNHDYLGRTRVFVNVGGVWSREVDVTEEECA